jgi:hypothetical protein
MAQSDEQRDQQRIVWACSMWPAGGSATPQEQRIREVFCATVTNLPAEHQAYCDVRDASLGAALEQRAAEQCVLADPKEEMACLARQSQDANQLAAMRIFQDFAGTCTVGAPR